MGLSKTRIGTWAALPIAAGIAALVAIALVSCTAPSSRGAQSAAVYRVRPQSVVGPLVVADDGTVWFARRPSYAPNDPESELWRCAPSGTPALVATIGDEATALALSSDQRLLAFSDIAGGPGGTDVYDTRTGKVTEPTIFNLIVDAWRPGSHVLLGQTGPPDVFSASGITGGGAPRTYGQLTFLDVATDGRHALVDNASPDATPSAVDVLDLDTGRFTKRAIPASGQVVPLAPGAYARDRSGRVFAWVETAQGSQLDVAAPGTIRLVPYWSPTPQGLVSPGYKIASLPDGRLLVDVVWSATRARYGPTTRFSLYVVGSDGAHEIYGEPSTGSFAWAFDRQRNQLVIMSSTMSRPRRIPLGRPAG